MTEKQRGQVRHILTAAGGVLIAAGVMTEGESAEIVNAVMAAAGAVSVAVGAVWSWRSK